MIKNNIITSAIISTVIVFLAMVLLPSFLNVENERVDTGTHQPAHFLFTGTNQPDDNLITFQIRIEALLEQQQILIEQNQQMGERIAKLESAQFHEADKLIDLVDTQTVNESPISIDQEERDMAAASDTFSGDFENLADQLFNEEYDSVWASEMESSFDEVAERLQQYSPGSTIITSTDCRSQSCIVEFTHQVDVDQALIAYLLPARGAKEIVLKHIQEGDSFRTLAIYKR